MIIDIKGKKGYELRWLEAERHLAILEYEHPKTNNTRN